MVGHFARERRLISRSTAARTKSARVSPGSNSASILAFVPTGKRAGHVSCSFFGRAICCSEISLIDGASVLRDISYHTGGETPMPVPATYTAADGIRDCEAQLAQVQARIADALESRKTAQARGYGQATWAAINQNLHTLYTLEWDIKQDMARLAA